MNDQKIKLANDDPQVQSKVAALSSSDKALYEAALTEGLTNEKCMKCGVIFLAHHHFIRCAYAVLGECPMVSDTESVLHKILKD